MRVVFLVIASEDAVHQTDLEIQRQTWAASLPSDFRVIWLRGSEEKVATIHGDTLFVPCRELYENILKKTILGLRYIVENIDFDILVRTNVSTYFDCKRLFHELSRNIYSKPFFGGYIDKTKGGYFDNRRASEYISGTGIFLSREAAMALYYLNPDVYNGIPDDVAISNYLSSQNFFRIRMHRNNLASTHLFFPSYFTRTKSSVDSSLASKRMLLLNQYFATNRIFVRIGVACRIIKLEIIAFFNHPESKIRYLQRNRVVIESYIKTKGWRIWQNLFRH